MTNEYGYYDFHVHVGEQISGYDLRDSFSDLARLSEREQNPENPPLLGIGAFVTEEATEPLSAKLTRMQELAAKDFGLPVFWHLTPIHSSLEEIYPLLQEGHDLKFYTCYSQMGLRKDYEEIDRWMAELKDLKTRILVHCEDDLIIERSSAQQTFRIPFDHTFRRPEIAEDKAVGIILDLAVKHSHPVHIVHISSPTSAMLVKEAKRSFDSISCETAPQYLLHNEELLREPDAHRLLCTPPYRKESSRGKLLELLQDGVIDIIASDHCPFPDTLKDKYKSDLSRIPMGIPGVATLYSSLHEALVVPGKIKAEDLVRMTYTTPKKLMNLEG